MFNANEQFFSYVMAKTSFLQWNDDVRYVLRPTHLTGSLVLAHWNNSLQIDMSHHSRHIILIPSQPVFVLIPIWSMLNREATNTNFIVLGLNRPLLELMIYHTPPITPWIAVHLIMAYNTFKKEH
jgi:hypothetical protein